MLTFLMSALWHGLYPMYYFMFFMAALFTETCKDIYRAKVLFKSIPAPLDYILAQFLVTLVMNYLGTTITMLSWERGYLFFQGTYWYVFIGIPVTFAIAKFSGMVKYAKKIDEANKKKKAEAETKKDK